MSIYISEQEECPICLECDYHDNPLIVLVECGHKIHNVCFSKQYKSICPLCRCNISSISLIKNNTHHSNNSQNISPISGYIDITTSNLSTMSYDFSSNTFSSGDNHYYVPTSGVYLINADISIINDSQHCQNQLDIIMNESTIARTTSYDNIYFQNLISANAGDTICVNLHTPISSSTQSNLNIFLLR